MLPEDFFVDVHCHPALKPYARSFRKKPPGQNAANRRRRNSIWYRDQPTVFDKGLNILAGLSRFTQSDLTTAVSGEVGVLVVSLYPLEKRFVMNDDGMQTAPRFLIQFVTQIPKKRTKHICKMPDYFSDLEDEYAFYRQLDGKKIGGGGGKMRYRLARNASDILNGQPKPGERTIYLVLSIEGGHVFDTGLPPFEEPPDSAHVLGRVQEVKDWPHRPVFITLAHHFWNDLCGHAESLQALKGVVDQSFMLGTGMTDLGREVVRRLLDDSDGKRILIDLKHMSLRSRKEYYELLDREFGGEDVPLVVSHGAATGLVSPDHRRVAVPGVAHKLNTADINFFDDEIIRIARSNGLFGLQLDERRVASAAELRAAVRLRRREMLHVRSGFIWNQIQHIGEVLDREGLFAWDIQSIGSDFDGIINPLNGFWTAAELPSLENSLAIHARDFMAGAGKSLQSINQIDPDELIDRVQRSNALRFLENYYR